MIGFKLDISLIRSRGFDKKRAASKGGGKKEELFKRTQKQMRERSNRNESVHLLDCLIIVLNVTVIALLVRQWK